VAFTEATELLFRAGSLTQGVGVVRRWSQTLLSWYLPS